MPVSRSPSRPPSGSPAYSPTDLPAYRGGSSFSPLELSPLALYDVQDLSSMFQDTAGSTPAAVGSQVQKINDLSGNGYNATQTAGPILRQDAGGFYYLEFNGTTNFFDFGPVASAAKRHIALVGEDDSGGGSTRVLLSTASDQYIGVNGTGSWITFFTGDGSKVAGPATSKSYCGLTQDASGYILDAGGTTITGANPIATRSYQQIGRFSAGGGLYWSGKIYSLSLYPSTLTAAQRSALKSYLERAAGA